MVAPRPTGRKLVRMSVLAERWFILGSRNRRWSRHVVSAEGSGPEVNKMPIKYLFGAALLVATVVPAAAQEFYVVRDTSTKKCTIVDKKPTTTTTTVVGDGVYKTRVEAESAMKSVKVCTSD
jgi:hypothetical protein